jgi:RNA polymerase sigma factor (sigma-70 family)
VYEKYKRMSVLTKQEFNTLFQKYKSGDKSAKEEIIKHNIRLVLKESIKYKNLMCLDDVIQEGMIGLINAIEHYELGKAAFSTYATRSINRNIVRAIDNTNRLIRIPCNLMATARKTGNFDDFPTATLILDNPLDEDNDNYSTFKEQIPSDEDITEYAEENELHQELDKLLLYCKPRTRTIIKTIFGYYGEPKTAVQVAAEIGTSHQNTNKLKQIGLSTLRKHATKSLEYYWRGENVQC